MKNHNLYWVDAFTDKPFFGNPAVVIVDADDIPDEIKQKIAREMNVSETIFVSKSEVANFKVQFFTPKQETVLCGHGTIGTFWLLSSLYRIQPVSDNPVILSQETKAGIFPVELHFNKDKNIESIMMFQAPPVFYEVEINSETISKILGVPIEAIDNDFPLKIVSTGRPKLMIPIKNRKILYDIYPNYEMISNYCIEKSITGFHLFTFDTHNSNSITAARHFAPLAGVNEDPVTGIAAGALGCYLSEFGNDTSSKLNFQMEQGFTCLSHIAKGGVNRFALVRWQAGH
jgi:PhzF family phenazine biosynthesis protein